MNEVFYCYSSKLKTELLQNGERYIAKNLHPKTNKFYWLFLRSENLLKYLTKRKQESDLR